MSDPNKELAEVLRELRRSSKHRSQLLFSIAIGRDRSYVSNVERKLQSPTANVLFEMAQQLEMPLSEIFRKVEERLKEKEAAKGSKTRKQK